MSNGKASADNERNLRERCAVCGMGCAAGAGGVSADRRHLCYDYTNTANWADGVVDGVITNTQTGNITLTFSGDVVLDHGWYTANRSVSDYSIEFKSANGTQTVTLGGDVYNRMENPASQITPLKIGTGTSGDGTFFLDIGGDRIFGGDGLASGWPYRNIPIYAKIIDRSGENYAVQFTGKGGWSLASSNTFSGPLIIDGGTITLTEKEMLATTNIVVTYPGRLGLENFSRVDGHWVGGGR